jgi:GNAT superfamily N-acetyltransferase
VFSTPELAARIDRAEARLCAAIAKSSAAQRPDVEPLVLEVGGGLGVFAGPTSPTNKLIGLGFDGPVGDEPLDELERQFAARGARLQAEVSTLADPALHGQLCARGYMPAGFENVLGHPLSTGVGALPGGIVVEPAAPADVTALVEIMVEGFGHPDAGGVGGDVIPPPEEIRRWFLVTMSVPGFRGYLARTDGRIAGGAILRLDEGIAQFSGAATLPAFRRRGVQTALLRARLADAGRAGCHVGVVVTQPASKSQQNVQREGFALLYARQLLVKDVATGS